MELEQRVSLLVCIEDRVDQPLPSAHPLRLVLSSGTLAQAPNHELALALPLKPISTDRTRERGRFRFGVGRLGMATTRELSDLVGDDENEGKKVLVLT